MESVRVEVQCFNKDHELYNLFDSACFCSKNLYNLSTYYIRQVYIFTSRLKQGVPLKENEIQFLEMINKKVDEYNVFKENNCKKKDNTFKKQQYFSESKKTVSFDFLNFLLKETDAYRSLNTHVSQQVLMVVIENWKSYFSSIRDWLKHPEKYTGRPSMPYYKDKTKGRNTVILPSDCFTKKGSTIYLTKRLNKAQITTTVDKPILVRINQKNGFYTVDIVYKIEIPNTKKQENILGIDLGINNFVTMVNTIGLQPIVVKGEVIKSYNRYYNKRKAHYTSILEKETGRKTSKRLQTLNQKRYWFMKDFMHKTSRFIIDYCVGNDIDTIVIGKNDQWKTNINLGSVTNQKFVLISYDLLINQLAYKAENEGINVIVHEESYTSKASFLDCDEIPEYKKGSEKKKFSGKRIHRGLYKSANGTLINADVNGAYNTVRKVIPSSFNDGIVGAGRHPIKLNILA